MGVDGVNKLNINRCKFRHASRAKEQANETRLCFGVPTNARLIKGLGIPTQTERLYCMLQVLLWCT